MTEKTDGSSKEPTTLRQILDFTLSSPSVWVGDVEDSLSRRGHLNIHRTMTESLVRPDEYNLVFGLLFTFAGETTYL